MRKLMGIAAVAATCSAPVLALPAAASAQALPVPTDPPQLPSLPALPVPIPIPTDAVVTVIGQVFDAAGNLLGVVDSVTGLLIPAAPPETPVDPGTTPSGSPSGSTSAPVQPSSTTTSSTSTTPTTSAGGTSSSTPASVPSREDTVAPGLSLRVRHATHYRSARRKGLRVTARCTEACRLTLRLTKGAQYASLTKTLPANKTTTLALRLSSGAKQVLRRAKHATKLTLRGQAVDAAGNHSTIISRKTIVKPRRR
jgi:hypothetical protein